jgi:hypothetical protein
MKRLLILFTGIFLIFGCNEADEKTALPIPQQYTDWFYFNKGSYWVYDRNDLDIKDTLAVDTSIFLFVNNSEPPYDMEEYLRISYEANPFSITYDHLTATSALSRNFTDSTWYPIYDISNSEPGKELVIHDSFGNVVGTSELENFYADYTIGDNAFDSVMVVFISDLVKTRLMRYYFAKGIGTAKIEAIENYDTTIWVLNEWVVVNSK